MAGVTNVGDEYAARFVLPDLIERGRPTTLRCPVYLGGSLVAPTAGSVSVYDASDVAQVDGAPVVESGSVATYSYTAPASLQVGEGWRVEWTLTIAGAPFHTRNDAALVRAILRNPVTDQDLFEAVRGLNPSGSDKIHSMTDFQDIRSSAWQTIERRLINKGNRPNLIISPSSLFDASLNLALANTFDTFASRLNEAYGIKAKEYRERYEAAWKELRFLYDAGDTGTTANVGRKAVMPGQWMM